MFAFNPIELPTASASMAGIGESVAPHVMIHIRNWSRRRRHTTLRAALAMQPSGEQAMLRSSRLRSNRIRGATPGKASVSPATCPKLRCRERTSSSRIIKYASRVLGICIRTRNAVRNDSLQAPTVPTRVSGGCTTGARVGSSDFRGS